MANRSFCCIPLPCFDCPESHQEDLTSGLVVGFQNMWNRLLRPRTSNGRDEENVDVDLDSLTKYISDLLERIETMEEGKSPRQKQANGMKWPTGSDLTKLEELLSSGIDFACELKSFVPGVLKEILKTLEHASVATAGLLVVAYGLERYEEVSTNKKDCLHLLHRMHDVANKVKKLPERMRDVVENAITLIMEGAITCCMQMTSSSWNRYLNASGNKEQLCDITKRLSDLYTDIIIESLLLLLNDKEEKRLLPRGYPEYAVGIDGSIRQVLQLLDWGSNENARAVVLHGLGGIGKTTLADAVFSLLDIPRCKYSKVKLFENIGSTPNVVKLQEKILSDLKGSESNREIRGYEDGQRELGDTLKKVQALIYIDNVLDDRALEQLLPPEYLMSSALKVRLLITARDSDVGKVCAVKIVEGHRMEGISPAEATRLFDDTDRNLNPDLLNRIIERCAGIPLLLKLIARAIRQTKDDQEVCQVIEEFEKLEGKNFSSSRIEPYFFAYDMLPPECKDPFLDICSFFHGWEWGTVAQIVGKSELEMLESRALVTQNTTGLAKVHDVILELGRKKSEGERFNFTSASQVKVLLDREEKDIQAIKGIWLDENTNLLHVSALKLDLMSNSLRVLALGSLSTIVRGKCSRIFEKLVFFKAQVTDLPFHVSKFNRLKYLSYKPKELNLCDLPSSLSHMEFDGSLHSHPLQISSTDLQQFRTLAKLSLINFERLKNLPEISDQLNGLVEVSLSGCQSLKVIPKSISRLRTLRILRMNKCYSLTKLPEDFGSLNSLQELHLHGCKSLKALPNTVEKLSSLKLLDLSYCISLRNLPTGLGNLTSLVKLNLTHCDVLESIPESIRDLKELQPMLDMSCCRSLAELPNGFCNLSSIRDLSLAHCGGLKKLPDGFGELTSLRGLDVTGCTALEKLPEGFGKLNCLEELVLTDCRQIKELCNDFHCLSSLQTLDLSGCSKLEKLPQDFHCLASLQHLYLRSCAMLEGKWMDDIGNMKRLQFVHIEGSEQLERRWEEIQRGGHQSESWSFVVTAGQLLSMPEHQKESIEKTLLSDFDRLLTNGQEERRRLSDLSPDTHFLLVCDVVADSSIVEFPWPLIEETLVEIQNEFRVIYIGPRLNKLRPKVKEKILALYKSIAGAREVSEKLCLIGAGDDATVSKENQRYFRMQIKMVGDGKRSLCCQHLTDREIEKILLVNCPRYIRLKRLVKNTQESNMNLLRELFAPGDQQITHVFQKHQPQQVRTESSEAFTCGVDKLEGKNILLEMRPAQLCYDIRLSSLKKLYDKKESLNLEIISIPVVDTSIELDVINVYEKFSMEVPWLVLQNSWTVITRAVKFFLAKQCGWKAGDEHEKCYTSIMWIIEPNGRITTYKPSLFCKSNTWEIPFNHLESVSCQVRWGVKCSSLMNKKIEELRQEEWKQLRSMSTLEFLFNHLESVFDEVKKVMLKGKLICLYSGSDEKVPCSIQNALMEVRDNIHIIYIPGYGPQNMKTFNMTDMIKKDCYYPWGEAPKIEGVSLLNLAGYEAVRFWMRLLHLKEEIDGMDDSDKQFCEMRRLLHSFPVTCSSPSTSKNRKAAEDECMAFMYEDGKMVATFTKEIMKWLFHFKTEGKAKRLMQLLIKVSMEEGKETHHDSGIPNFANNIQSTASVEQESVHVDMDKLSEYTSELLEQKELYQLLEFNKEGKRSSRPRGLLHWPTSRGFSMLKDFLAEGINANWVKDIISRHSEGDNWKTVTKSLLKGLGEENWAAAGLLVIADILNRFETVSANRNKCLFILDEMNILAKYLKQFNERPGLWTGMKRESIGSIVIGSIICCAQIDHSKFGMFVEKCIDNNLLNSFQRELKTKSGIMAQSTTVALDSESVFFLKRMCNDNRVHFVTGDLASENENKAGPFVGDETDPSSMARASPTATNGEEEYVAASNAARGNRNAQPDITPPVAASSS